MLRACRFSVNNHDEKTHPHEYVLRHRKLAIRKKQRSSVHLMLSFVNSKRETLKIQLTRKKGNRG